jgi:hypothetical protein
LWKKPVFFGDKKRFLSITGFHPHDPILVLISSHCLCPGSTLDRRSGNPVDKPAEAIFLLFPLIPDSGFPRLYKSHPQRRWDKSGNRKA